MRILIADDNALFLEGLHGLLEEQHDFQVVGTAADGAETLKLAAELGPDILLLELEVPKVHGMEVLRRLGSNVTMVMRTILLAASMDDDQMAQAFDLGARGLILKDSAPSVLWSCIRAVMRGKYWALEREVSDPKTIGRDRGQEPQDHKHSKRYGLTPREMEVMVAIVAGRTNREIAQKFGISEQTVKHHLTHIFDKVGVYNRLELALFAIHHGLVGRN
jgi:DNA-binding NarL/FixJ family response regulator